MKRNLRKRAYKPRGKNRVILDEAWRVVQSTPYRVSLRHVFYQLIRPGLYSDKSEYIAFKNLTKRVRKAFYEGWHPGTFIDDTRVARIGGIGHETVVGWLTALENKGIACNLDRWFGQDYYPELWVESRGSTPQFRHYTKDLVTLRPLGGDASLDFKWEVANHFDDVWERYGLPIVVLYFGDRDKKGEQIGKTVIRDVRAWSDVPEEDITYVHCGLTMDQVNKYELVGHPKKPGSYEWEALSDEQAKEIIYASMGAYINIDALNARAEEEKEAEDWLRSELSGLSMKWIEDHDPYAITDR